METSGSVGPAGRPVQQIAGAWRVHSHNVVGFAERIGHNSTRFHVPAAVEDLIGNPGHAPAKLGRFEIRIGLLHGVQNPASHPFNITGVGLDLATIA